MKRTKRLHIGEEYYLGCKTLTGILRKVEYGLLYFEPTSEHGFELSDGLAPLLNVVEFTPIEPEILIPGEQFYMDEISDDRAMYIGYFKSLTKPYLFKPLHGCYNYDKDKNGYIGLSDTTKIFNAREVDEISRIIKNN